MENQNTPEKPELWNDIYDHENDKVNEAVGYELEYYEKIQDRMTDEYFDIKSMSERAEWIDKNVPKKLLALMYVQTLRNHMKAEAAILRSSGGSLDTIKGLIAALEERK